MFEFSHFDWYWSVGSKTYSSKLNAYLDGENPEFTAFLNAGGIPTNLANEDELIGVLLPYDIVPPFCTDEKHTQWALDHAPPAMRHLYKKMMGGR